jgi:hypothetical protein
LCACEPESVPDRRLLGAQNPAHTRLPLPIPSGMGKATHTHHTHVHREGEGCGGARGRGTGEGNRGHGASALGSQTALPEHRPTPRRAAIVAGMLSRASTHARTSSRAPNENSSGMAGADAVEDAVEPITAVLGCGDGWGGDSNVAGHGRGGARFAAALCPGSRKCADGISSHLLISTSGCEDGNGWGEPEHCPRQPLL